METHADNLTLALDALIEVEELITPHLRYPVALADVMDAIRAAASQHASGDDQE